MQRKPWLRIAWCLLLPAGAWADTDVPGTIERYGDNRFGRSCLVARRLVEAQGGRIWIDSPASGDGTLVQLRLPVAAVPQASVDAVLPATPAAVSLTELGVL